MENYKTIEKIKINNKKRVGNLKLIIKKEL